MEIIACIIVENGRKKLLEMAKKYELTSPRVIEASRQLDKLLNLFQHQQIFKGL